MKVFCSLPHCILQIYESDGLRLIIAVPLIRTKVRLAKHRTGFKQTRIMTCVILHESNGDPVECQNIEGQLLHDTRRERTSRRRAINSRLTSFFIWPIKIVVHVWSAWIGPPEPFSESRRREDVGGLHWRARKRDIIFMLSPRVSKRTTLLPSHSWEREGKERAG